MMGGKIQCNDSGPIPPPCNDWGASQVQELIDNADTQGGGTVGGADLEILLETG